ncbi:hypothetical protein AB0M02_17185 [Actinoplanes sp. NPDC051861]|uniref:hypothetical protein n=1 Tax=Actinoplanes sp. NPDC051861 TaxID=3155170 RepID=UPI0034390725
MSEPSRHLRRRAVLRTIPVVAGAVGGLLIAARQAKAAPQATRAPECLADLVEQGLV